MTTSTLIRKFKTGSTLLPDPDPSLTPEDVRKLYAVNYPHLANAVIGEAVVHGDELHYEFTPAAVKTKG